MKKLLFLLSGICFIAATPVLGQSVLFSYHYASIPKQSLNYIPGLVPEYDVEAYYILYATTDAFGDTVSASGMCFIPSTDTCNFFPLISYQHGTILKKSDVPSRLNGESLIGQIFSSLGNIVLCPDYLGLGDSPGFHPYCHGETEAIAVIDFIRASREMLEDSLEIFDNGQVFLTGYSQGGHATMATHKYIEYHNLLSEIQLVASAPCSGPYHISGAQSEMIFNTPDYSSPAYLVYLLYSYNYVYQNLFDGSGEVFQSPYDVIIPPYMNGNYSTSQLNNALPDSIQIFMNEDFYQAVIDDMIDKVTPFWQNLIDNDNFDWVPVVPVRMYYCEADEQVSYMNSVNALSAMVNGGATDVQAINVNPTAGHGDCGIPSIVSAYNWFDSLRNPCTGNTVVTVYATEDFNIYPNPASTEICIENIVNPSVLKCFDINGKSIAQWNIDAYSSSVINIEDLKNGIYHLQVIDYKTNTILFYQKLIIIR